jgi:hypothetical protein
MNEVQEQSADCAKWKGALDKVADPPERSGKSGLNEVETAG